MTAPRYGAPPSPPGERWNVNLPAVIGVVFVFLLGVVVWVIASGDDAPDTVGSPGEAAITTTVPPEGARASGTTSPAPMPSSTAASTSPTTTTIAAEATTTSVTVAPGAGPDAVPGDLGIAGHPMQRPGCDGAFITILTSAVGDEATADGIARVLDAYPSSSYLRTDQTCPSLRPDVDGEPIYVVYLGPFAYDVDACSARVDGPEGAYARVLSSELGPDHGVSCA
jgi:serine/threonine-protein kinase